MASGFAARLGAPVMGVSAPVPMPKAAKPRLPALPHPHRNLGAYLHPKKGR